MASMAPFGNENQRDDDLYRSSGNGDYNRDFRSGEDFGTDPYYRSQGYDPTNTYEYGDPSAPEVKDYYTGYKPAEGEQQYADPFAPPTAKDYNIDAKIIVEQATPEIVPPKKSSRVFILLIIGGILVFIYSLYSLCSGIATNAGEQNFISTAAFAEGTITHINSIHFRHSYVTHRYISYKYTAADGQIYEGEDELSPNQQNSLGYDDVGGKVMVYYDSNNPSRSRLVAYDFTQTLPRKIGGMFTGIACVAFGAYLLWCIKTGKYVIEKIGKNTRIRKIK